MREPLQFGFVSVNRLAASSFFFHWHSALVWAHGQGKPRSGV